MAYFGLCKDHLTNHLQECATRPEGAEASFVQHALKGQKLLAQGSALGNDGRKPVALYDLY